MNGDGKNPHGQKAEDAAFGTDRSARQPSLAVERRARHVRCKEHATIRNGIEKRLSKIKARMPTHSEPEVAGPSQSESKKQPGSNDARGTRSEEHTSELQSQF